MARTVNITFNADFKDFDKAMAHFRQQMGMAENVSTQTARSVGESFGKMGQLFGGYLSARAVADFGRQVVTVRGQFQAIDASLKVLLGSEKEATKLMSELMETATKTPFDLQQVANGAKQLLAYGESVDKVNETLIMLSDISSGAGQPINDLIYLYGTMMTQGRAYAQDIRQFTGRGIPLIEELAKVMGVAKDEVSALVTEGKIGFPEIQKAIQNMTSEGGKFYKMSETISTTVQGQLNRLQDAYQIMLNKIGESNDGLINSGIAFTSSLLENYEKIGNALAGLIITYGAFKTAIFAVNLATKAKEVGSLIEAIKKLTVVQKVLNSVVMKNPYIALVSVLAGLSVSLYSMYDHGKRYEKVTKDVTEAHNRFGEVIDGNKKKIYEEITAIREQTSSLDEQIVTLNKLKALKGYENLTLEDVKTMSSEELESLVKSAKIQEEKNMLEARKAQYQAVLYAKQRRTQRTGKVYKTPQEVYKLYNEWKSNQGFFEDSYKNFEKYAEEEVKKLSERLDDINKLIEKKVEESEKKKIQNYAFWESKYEEAESARKALETKGGEIADKAEFERLTSVMNEAQKMMDLYKNKTKDATNAQNDFNSKFQQLKDLVYSTTINEKEGTYLGNIDAIKAEYNNQIEQLDLLREEDKGKGYSKEQLRVLNEYYDKIAQNYLKQMQKALEDNEAEYRNWLADFNETINSDTKTALEKGLREVELKGNELRKQAQANAVDETEASENVKKVNEWELRQKENVQVAYLIEREDELLAKTEKRLQVNEANVGEEETSLRLLEANRDSLERKIAIMENQTHLSEEEKSQIEDMKIELQGVNKEIEEITSGIRSQVEMFNSLGDSVSRIGNSLSSLGGKFDSWGQMIGSLGSSMNQFADMYGKTKGFKDFSEFSTGDKVSGIAGAVATFTELAVSAGAQVRANREMQEQWNQSIRDGAHEMNLLKLEAMDAEPTNIFGVEDLSKGLKDSVAKFKEARKMLSDYSNELAMGQVQTGTKKNMDWGTLGTHIITGAGAGTVGASWAGPFAWIGTVVGAVVGTVTGIVNGLKEVPVFESLRSVYGEIYDKDTYELNQRIIADYDKMDDATKKMIDNWDEIKTKMQEADKELEDYIKNLVGELGSEVSDLLVQAFRNDDIFSAIDGITNYLNNKIANIVHQKVFSSIFEEDFKRLSESMKLGAESGDITAQLISGVSSIRSKVNQYMNVMNDLDKEMKKQGFDLFSDIETMKDEALSGSGLRLTAEEIKESNGNFMGLKMTAMEINTNVANMKAIAQTHNDLLRSNQNALMAIVTNTAHLQYIRDDIANMNRKGVLLR